MREDHASDDDSLRPMRFDQPGRPSILTIMAGELATRYGETMDLCGDCCEGFDDWLPGPHRTAGFAPGATVASQDAASA